MQFKDWVENPRLQSRWLTSVPQAHTDGLKKEAILVQEGRFAAAQEKKKQKSKEQKVNATDKAKKPEKAKPVQAIAIVKKSEHKAKKPKQAAVGNPDTVDRFSEWNSNHSDPDVREMSSHGAKMAKLSGKSNEYKAAGGHVLPVALPPPVASLAHPPATASQSEMMNMRSQLAAQSEELAALKSQMAAAIASPPSSALVTVTPPVTAHYLPGPMTPQQYPPPPPPFAQQHLSPGWRETLDPSGRQYYYNTFTQQSTWECPSGPPPPPPPQPPAHHGGQVIHLHLPSPQNQPNNYYGHR